MRHSIVIDGATYRLRPVTLDDAEFIIELRRDRDRNRYVHAISDRVEDQRRWIEQYDQRPGDYYFIIERMRDLRPEGTLGIYDEDREAKMAEWGRWLLRPGSMAAFESAMLAYTAAFDRLDLDMVYCRTIKENARVVSFHRSFGLEERGLLPNHVRLDDVTYDVVEQRISREMWQRQRPLLVQKLADVAAVLSAM